MKIGGENSSDKVSKANFEQLAEDGGLVKPLVRRRVPELAEAVVSNLDKTGIEHPVAEALASLIHSGAMQCERASVSNGLADSAFRDREGPLASTEDRAWTYRRTLADLWGLVRSWNE